MSEGVSWVHDRLRKDLEDRRQQLLEFLARGVPYHEYVGFIGRLKENERQQADIAEMFKDFYQGEEEDV